uniref:Nuclear pore protein n=1 Tax=Trypanosoma congolense (strain IL3000) TaxID=1068625 RepID=G0UWR6_TRYCI|nr:putative nucleoporin interacting component (NUP93) [Trypanosoma congolense IL3000]
MMSFSNFTGAPGGTLIAHNHTQSTSAIPQAGSSDSNNDIRGSITRLTARARQLLVDDKDMRVVRNGVSTYEMSRRVAADWHARAQVTGYPSTSQASVELFMASHGFNLQEQLRLLHQLQSSQLPLVGVTHTDSHDTPWNAEASEELGSALEAFVARRRQEIIQKSVDETHQRVNELMQERSEAIIRASWEKYGVEIADALETASLRAKGSGSRVSNLGKNDSTAGTAASLQRHSGVIALLNGRDTVSVKVLNKISAFAHIVHTQPPQKWMSYFAAHVVDEAPRVTDEVAVMWSTVEQILRPIMERGSASTIMTYVHSSRRVMERKALAAVLSVTLKVDPERLSDLENMHASRLVSIVERYTSSSNPWVHIFTAMRCGRYDAASIAANSAGFTTLEKNLKLYDTDNITEQCTQASSLLELRTLYSEEATRSDPYRHIVLFLLLAGKTGESNDVIQSTVAALSSRVARSLEDTLWIRLFCIRSVDPKDDNKIQSLSEMQRLLLDDMQDLVALVRGNVVRLASLMFHALLPSSGVRLLTENDITYIDGVHLAVCFHNCKVLHCSEAEVPLDLSRVTQQYCTIALLDADKRQLHAPHVGPAIFWYFCHTGLSDAFVDYCNNELVCAKLFGQRAGGGHSDGALFQHGGAPSNEVLDAMERIAEGAASRGKTELAVHVLTTLESAASLLSDDVRCGYALSRAVQIICPALAQAFHQDSSSAGTNLFAHASILQERLARAKSPISSSHTDAFRLLCKMGDVFSSAARGDAMATLQCFLSLPFVPTTPGDVERCAELFDTAPDVVATAVPPIVLLTMRQMLYLAKEQKTLHVGASDTLLHVRSQAQQIVAWVRRWRARASGSLVEELLVLERSLMQ